MPPEDSKRLADALINSAREPRRRGSLVADGRAHAEALIGPERGTETGVVCDSITPNLGSESGRAPSSAL